MQRMSGTPFFTLLSFLTPYPESVRMDGVRRRQNKFSGIERYGQPKYSYEKAIYVVMISFALDFFFWIDRLLIFFYADGAPLRALRGRGRSAKKTEIRQV